MNINKMTEKLQQGLVHAGSLATSLNHQEIDTPHLLSSLLQDHDGLAARVLTKAGYSVPNILQDLKQILDKKPSVTGSGAEPYVSGDLNRALLKADDYARAWKDDYLSIEHVLLAMLESKDYQMKQLIKKYDIKEKQLKEIISQIRGNSRVMTQNPEALMKSLKNMDAT